MLDAIQEIRVRAEVLHRRALTLDANTLRRFRRLPHFDPTDIRRHECFTVLATEMGFPSWPHAKRVLSGLNTTDFGTLLCPNKCGGHLNLWYKAHEEAATVRERRGGWLLAYSFWWWIATMSKPWASTRRTQIGSPWVSIGLEGESVSRNT